MSRFYKIGTIFSRVDGLIRKGIIKPNDKPLWHEIYFRFPPDYTPDYVRPAPSTTVRQILYPEDDLRSQIHRQFSRKLDPVNLNDDAKTYSMELVEKYKELINSGNSHEEALTKIMGNVNDESLKNFKSKADLKLN